MAIFNAFRRKPRQFSYMPIYTEKSPVAPHSGEGKASAESEFKQTVIQRKMKYIEPENGNKGIFGSNTLRIIAAIILLIFALMI